MWLGVGWSMQRESRVLPLAAPSCGVQGQYKLLLDGKGCIGATSGSAWANAGWSGQLYPNASSVSQPPIGGMDLQCPKGCLFDVVAGACVCVCARRVLRAFAGLQCSRGVLRLGVVGQTPVSTWTWPPSTRRWWRP